MEETPGKKIDGCSSEGFIAPSQFAKQSEDDELDEDYICIICHHVVYQP